MGMFEAEWQQMSQHYAGIVDREQLEEWGDHPISALFNLVDDGLFPPPELLLTMTEMFTAYMAGRGKLSLEEAFFGPTKRKAGNFAQRFAIQGDRFMWGLKLLQLMRQGGYSKGRAAEILAEQLGGNVEPETIARVANIPKKARALVRKKK